MENTFFERYSDLCRRDGKSPNGVARELDIPSGSITAWKRGVTPRNSTLVRIAEYFGVTTDYLVGKNCQPPQSRLTDEEIKFALFGGDGPVTDAMFEEVRQFAQYVKFREGQK